MKKWLPRIKTLADMLIEAGKEGLFYLGVCFAGILTLTSVVVFLGEPIEELPALELGLFMKGPLPYLWCGLFGVFLATRVQEWAGTIKSIHKSVKERPELKAKVIAKLSQVWNRARGQE